jgi:peptide/nickel transport system substrate-binding protein
MVSPLGDFNDPALEKRLPFDLDAAKKLMAAAGYADGFEVTLDCPNDRYVNDEEICKTLASMWAKIGLKVRVNAMPRSIYFAKLGNLDTSMYMLGWGGAATDAENTLTPIYRTRGANGVGQYNYGQVNDPQMDELAAASSREPDPVKREALIKAAVKRHNEQVHHIPLHRQFIPWAMRSNVEAVHRADNWLEWAWVKIGK